MQNSEYHLMRSAEESYWWYRCLRRLVSRSAARLLKDVPSPRILDAGCGTGGTLDVLRRKLPAATLFGIDKNPVAVQLTAERGVADVREASVEALPFESGTFDLVVCLDVLYFKGLDPRRALSEFARVLRPGGGLVLNLPAFEFLKGEHDLAVSGVRRYTTKSLKKSIEGLPFTFSKMSYWNMTFFPFLAVWRPLSLRLARQASPASDLKPLPRWLNAAMRAIGNAEITLMDFLPLPFGSSLFAVARKRGPCETL